MQREGKKDEDESWFYVLWMIASKTISSSIEEGQH